MKCFDKTTNLKVSNNVIIAKDDESTKPSG